MIVSDCNITVFNHMTKWTVNNTQYYENGMRKLISNIRHDNYCWRLLIDTTMTIK